MDAKNLRENRQHGTPGFPIGFYRIEREAGELILDHHWHEEIEFLRVVSGAAVFQIGLAVYEVCAGQALFIPGGEMHGAYPLHGGSCTYEAVVCDLNWLIGPADDISIQYMLPLQRGQLSLPAHWTGEQAWELAAIKQLETIQQLEESLDPARDLRVKIALLSLFADLITCGQWQGKKPGEDRESRSAERLKSVLAYMESHYARKLTLEELAGVAGMSEGHFSKVFRSYMRTTPIAYINQYRIRYAAGLLAETPMNVSEAALAAGFDNFSYFIKLFKSVYGCTPRAYRRK